MTIEDRKYATHSYLDDSFMDITSLHRTPYRTHVATYA